MGITPFPFNPIDETGSLVPATRRKSVFDRSTHKKCITAKDLFESTLNFVLNAIGCVRLATATSTLDHTPSSFMGFFFSRGSILAG
ncbi:MAG: hypothetical protein BWY32_03821 [bacterium ADurb.Bin243]|nr:MAG: hypothetical protein BWY32_03821 [bacterium ADurb.Bin243]